MAAVKSILVSKHAPTIMCEGHATINKKQEMEAKHDLELERIKNERELQQLQQVDNNELINVISMISLFQAL